MKYMAPNYAAGPKNYLDSNGQRIDLFDQIEEIGVDFVFPSYIQKIRACILYYTIPLIRHMLPALKTDARSIDLLRIYYHKQKRWGNI